MLVSILHRATGTALATGAVILFTWWLVAAASGPDAYANFHYYAVAADPADAIGVTANVLALIVAIGLTWSVFQHMASGIRHLVLDTGAGYELGVNRTWAMATIVISVTLTVLVWAAYFLARG